MSSTLTHKISFVLKKPWGEPDQNVTLEIPADGSGITNRPDTVDDYHITHLYYLSEPSAWVGYIESAERERNMGPLDHSLAGPYWFKDVPRPDQQTIAIFDQKRELIHKTISNYAFLSGSEKTYGFVPSRAVETTPEDDHGFGDDRHSSMRPH